MTVSAEGHTTPSDELTPSRRTPVGVAAAGAAFLGLVGFSSAVGTPAWSPKAAVVPALAAAGVIVLMTPGPQRARRSTWLARGFVAVAALAALLAARPALAVTGRYGLGTGLVFIVAVVGAWGLGLRATAADSRMAVAAVVAGAGLNAMVAMGQMATDLEPFGFPRFEARASGLMGNPVFLSPVLLVAVALLVPLLAEWWERRAYAAVLAAAFGVATMAAAMSLTASRSALALTVALAVWACRKGLRVGLVVTIMLTVGWLGGPRLDRPAPPAALFAQDQATATTASSGNTAPAPDKDTATDADKDPERISGVGATVAPGRDLLRARLLTWSAARHAVAERPVLGVGPGQFFGPGIRHRSLEAERDDPGRYFADAHNLVVEYATTTGLAGLALLLGWLLLAVRGARGPWAMVAVVLAVVHLVEPQHVALTPLAALALGLAVPREPERGHHWPARPAVAALWGSLALLGMAGGVALLVGDFELRQGRLDFRLSAARRANTLQPMWAQPAVLLSHINSLDGSIGAPRRRIPVSAAAAVHDREARRWLREAVRRQPDDSPLWTVLADLEYAQGDLAAARRHYQRALALNPWTVRALGGLGNVAAAQDRPAEALRWFTRARAIDPNLTEPTARLARLRSNEPTAL